METKADILDDICQLLGLDGFQIGIGSSIPRQFYSEVCTSFDLSDTGNSVDVSRRITQAAGLEWPDSADSAQTPSGGGGTVTLEGLQRVRQAVVALLDAHELTVNHRESVTLPAHPGEWTILEGQTTTRSILAGRFGCSKTSEIAASGWTENIMVFFDAAGGTVIASHDERPDVLALRLSSLPVVTPSEDSSGLSQLLNHASARKRLRVFEGTFGSVMYVGEFEVRDRDLVWSSDESVRVELQRVSPTVPKSVSRDEKPGEELDLVSIFAPYIVVDHPETLATDPLPFEVDPNLLDRALTAHAATQNKAAEWLVTHGVKPLSPQPDAPQFDLAWAIGTQIFVAEVKSIAPENEQRQFRLGLGQVLDYAQELDAVPVLLLSGKPSNPRLLAVASRARVLLLWPQLLADVDPQVL